MWTSNWKIMVGIGGALASIFLSGMIVDRLLLTHSSESGVESTAQKSVEIPVVKVIKIGNGVLEAEVDGGEVRLTAGESVGVVGEEGKVTLVLGDALEDYAVNAVPEGALFVASKNGKHYYALSDAQAKRLAPQNRVYFQTREEAEAAGYTEK